MVKQTLLFISLFVVSGIFAQNSDLQMLLDRIEERKNEYVQYDSYTSMAHSVSKKMNRKWTPKETTIVEKRITQEKGKRLEEILKATEIRKNKEKDVTEELRKDEAKRRKKQEKRIEKEGENNDGGGGSFSLGLDAIDPFAKEKRDLFEFSQGSDSLIGDRPVLCIQTTATQPSDTLYQGCYFVDKETMDILLMDIHPSKNPKAVKELHLKMWFNVLPGNYYVITDYWMKVYASIVIKGIRFLVEEQYSDYHIVEPATSGT